MDNMDSLYLVVAVISIIFAFISVFLFALDRKLSKLEKDLDSEDKK